MKIAIAGTGYVGLSNAMLLAQNHEVVAVDIMAEKIDLLNAKKSPIVDTEIEDFYKTSRLILLRLWTKNWLIKVLTMSLLPRLLIMIQKPTISILSQ